jgi:prepilin-type N-terminal cleavage/methylation domain-containing protein
MRTDTHSSRRGGFTLIELLVVISILAILAALTAGGISAVRTGQKGRITDETVTKLQKGLNSQITTVIDEATRDNNPFLPQVMPSCGNDKDRAKALLAYIYLRREFPQSIPEALAPVTVSGVITMQPLATFASLSGAGVLSPEQQSAVLLYAILQEKGNRGQVMPVDDSTGNAQTTIGGFKAFKDGYGTPISFVRWLENGLGGELNSAPYANTKLASLDPFDPLGKLATWPSAVAWGPQLNVPVFDAKNKVITVQSAGYDLTLGTPDDVFGYRLVRFGNKGN